MLKFKLRIVGSMMLITLCGPGGYGDNGMLYANPYMMAVRPLSLSDHDKKILWALNQVEASGRRFVQPRFEPAFYRRYLMHNPQFRDHENKYGIKAIASSFGPWQIMYSTAVQMGYHGRPDDLSQPEISLPFVFLYLESLRKKFDGNLPKVISAYNAGPDGVGTNPHYTEHVLEHFRKAPTSWRVYGT